jgi:hypothetical protein
MFDWYLVVIPRAYDIVGHVQSMVYMIEPIVEACDTILIPSCSSGDEAHYILLKVTPYDMDMNPFFDSFTLNLLNILSVYKVWFTPIKL